MLGTYRVSDDSTVHTERVVVWMEDALPTTVLLEYNAVALQIIKLPCCFPSVDVSVRACGRRAFGRLTIEDLDASN